MRLFEVANGYMGDGYVHVVCVAESEEKALEMARERFKADGMRYSSSYYENLTAELLCPDISDGFCTEIYG